MKKRWISFLVILGLTAGLAGCGTQSSQAAGDTKKEDTQTAGDAKTQEVQTVRLSDDGKQRPLGCGGCNRAGNF